MLIEDDEKNVIKFREDECGVHAYFGQPFSPLFTAYGDNRIDALMRLSVRMSLYSWECGKGTLGFRHVEKVLKDEGMVIEYKGAEAGGWVVQHWPEGKAENLLGAVHPQHPEIAVATIGLMLANPKRYDEVAVVQS